MLKKRIQALRTFTLRLKTDTRTLSKGTTAIVKFGNEAQYKALLGFGNFKEVHNPVRVIRKPPILDTVESTEKVVEPEKVTEPKEVTDESKDTSTPGKEWVCEICEKSFATSRGLKMHVVKAHPEMKKLDKPITEKICPNCRTKMIVSGEENIPDESHTIIFSCPVCEREEKVEA